jgi:DNA repair exonuclease SbcCD nuclease subunit
MSRLHQANIRVFAIAGNHDAANKMTKTLRMQAGVMLKTDEPETCYLKDLDVAIHGQGFATEAITNDLSACYPIAKSGCFNIGLLHTSATGRDGHERYAPCTIDGLLSKQYDYWALGHIHKREILHEEPYIVFPGNVQGRKVGESGPKGCMLVTVQDNRSVEVDFRCLDVLRWERCKVEVSGLCHAHERLQANPQKWTNEIRSLAAEACADEIWIEKVKFGTDPPGTHASPPADGPFGELLGVIEELCTDPKQVQRLHEEFAELCRKLPEELTAGPDPLRLNDPAWLQRMLPRVRPLLVSRLFARGSPQ